MSKELLNKLNAYDQDVVKRVLKDVKELQSWMVGKTTVDEKQKVDLVAYALIESTIREAYMRQQLGKLADIKAVYDEVLITQQLASDKFYQTFSEYVGNGPKIVGFDIPMLADEDDDDE